MLFHLKSERLDQSKTSKIEREIWKVAGRAELSHDLWALMHHLLNFFPYAPFVFIEVCLFLSEVFGNLWQCNSHLQ
jgi:hypothetical protein